MFTSPSLNNSFGFFNSFKNNENKNNKKIDNILTNNIVTNNIEKNYILDGSDIKWEDTIEFTFPIKGGRVIKVYDADTITIASKLPYDESPLYRLSVRLNGIDTPEIKGKGIITKEIAHIALSALEVDEYGLDEMDKRILLAIIDKFNGGPVGVGTLAVAVGEEAGTLEEV